MASDATGETLTARDKLNRLRELLRAEAEQPGLEKSLGDLSPMAPFRYTQRGKSTDLT